jgi:hypothetical protein
LFNIIGIDHARAGREVKAHWFPQNADDENGFQADNLRMV